MPGFDDLRGYLKMKTLSLLSGFFLICAATETFAKEAPRKISVAPKAQRLAPVNELIRNTSNDLGSPAPTQGLEMGVSSRSIRDET